MNIRKEFWALRPEIAEQIEYLKESGLKDPDLALEMLELMYTPDKIYILEEDVEDE